MSEEFHNPLLGNRPEMIIKLPEADDQISIIIVHRDAPAYLNLCLQSIAITSISNNYEIIVVDNASGKEGQELMDQLEEDGEIKVVRNKRNVYWGPAATQGAEVANKSSKYLVFMHCDVVIESPAWLDSLINVSQSAGSGLVGTEKQSFFMDNRRFDFIQEWCMLTTRECWEDAGPFPSDLPQMGPAFVYTMNAKKAGYDPQLIKTKICHHYRIFNLNVNEYERIVDHAMETLGKYARLGQPL